MLRYGDRHVRAAQTGQLDLPDPPGFAQTSDIGPQRGLPLEPQEVQVDRVEDHPRPWAVRADDQRYVERHLGETNEGVSHLAARLDEEGAYAVDPIDEPDDADFA
jgi:hypothetical protein